MEESLVHLVLIGGGGVVGRDLASVMDLLGIEFGVWEADYFTVDGATDETGDQTAESIADAMSREDTVWVNLAGLGDAYRCESDPISAVRLNVETTVRYSRLAAARGIPLLHLSTWEVYGNAGPLVSEDSLCRPESVYAETKFWGETMALEVGRILRSRIAALRIGPVIGPSMRPATAVRSFVDCVRAGAPLRVANGGRQTRQFLDYRDLASAIVKFARADYWRDPVYNVASHKPVSILELARVIAALSPSSKIVESPMLRQEPMSAVMSVDRIREELNWRAEFSVRESLTDVAECWAK